jgi:hypothetical protein
MLLAASWDRLKKNRCFAALLLLLRNTMPCRLWTARRGGLVQENNVLLKIFVWAFQLRRDGIQK